MRKQIIFYIILILNNVILIAQSIDSSRYQISTNLGINYNYFFGDHYSPPHYSIGNSASSGGPSGGITTKYCIDKLLGITFRYNLKRNFYISSNLTYFGLNSQSISNPDSVIKYVQSQWYNNPPKETHSFTNNIGISLHLGYYFKKFSVSVGPSFTLFNKRHFEELLLDNSKRNIIYNWRTYQRSELLKEFLYPSLNLNYLIIEKYPISIFFNTSIKSLKDYDFQTGIKITLLRIKNK